MKKILFVVIILFSIIFIIRYIGLIHWDTRFTNAVSINLTSPLSISLTKMNLFGFLFGMIIEWKSLKEIAKLNIKLNILLIPSIFCFCLGIIPNYFWSLWFAQDVFWDMVNALSINESHILFMVLSGVLFVRSLS